MASVTKKCALGCQVFLMIACVGLTTLCTAREPPKTRTPPVELYALLVDASVFPEGWQLWRGPQPIPEQERGERESYYVTFRYEGLEPGIVGASHEAFRYRNEIEAANSFSRHGFLNRHVITPWALPDEWSYESPVADRFKFACAEVDILGSYWICEAVGQYDEFISVFYTLLSPEYMTLEDVERILVAIDDRMAFYLEKDTE
jgi:hypothetical protein